MTGGLPTCAYPNGEDEGEHDHAMCEDVVAERAGVVDARPDDADPAMDRAAEHNIKESTWQ
ncbi:hypothetical protein AB0K20_23225 [Micromonospora matsumotoense]|uniref:hypothetical protein n=1 Tax=Micromonospora matsumotoense TaxID=121616 RepID=UPI00342D0B95